MTGLSTGLLKPAAKPPSLGVSSEISSGVESGTEVVITFSGDPGAEDSYELPEIFLAAGGSFPSAELTLDDLPWLNLCPASMLVLRAETILFVDCPLPNVCGLGIAGDGNGGVPRIEDIEAYWLSFDGDDGRCGGEVVLEAGAPSRGDAIREVEDTAELGLGGGRCGVD